MGTLRIIKPKMLAFLPLILLLVLAVACGDEATPTPGAVATPTTAPATSTPVPPTPTAMPKDEPTPTAMAKDEPTPTAMAKDEPTPTAMAKAEPTPTVQAKGEPDPTPTPVPAFKPTPTPTPVVTPTPRPVGIVTSTTNRLIIATTPSARESYVNWRTECCANFQDKRPIYEQLIMTAHETGQYYPELTTGWEVSPDAKTWTFDLRENVPWHFGYGDFTAADVVHTWEMYTHPDTIAIFSSTFEQMMGGTAENFEIVNDNRVIWNLAIPQPELVFHLSTRENHYVMVNKAQWDEGGADGWDRQPSGTGPYQFVERKANQFALYERVENHWRKTPEFKEMIFQFVHEDAVRLAMILTNEAHIVDLATDLHEQAQLNGMRVVAGFVPPTATVYNFGGMYLGTPENVDPDLKWLDKKVREAMNRAVNKQDILNTIFGGKGELAMLQYWHPTQQGWNPKWEEDFDRLYGYDPDRARELLAEAGFPNGFDMEILACPRPGFSELTQVDEALTVYFKDVGINAQIRGVDCGRLFNQVVSKEYSGLLVGWPPFSMGPPALRAVLLYASGLKGLAEGYTHPDIDALFTKLETEVDPDERQRLQVGIGDHLFYEYCCIPVVRTYHQAIVNPTVVAEYILVGTHAGFTHLEHIRAEELE